MNTKAPTEIIPRGPSLLLVRTQLGSLSGLTFWLGIGGLAGAGDRSAAPHGQ